MLREEYIGCTHRDSKIRKWKSIEERKVKVKEVTEGIVVKCLSLATTPSKEKKEK